MKCDYCNADRYHTVEIDYDGAMTEEPDNKITKHRLCLMCIYKRGKQIYDDTKFRNETQYKYNNTRNLQTDNNDF